jgi:MFS family permease
VENNDVQKEVQVLVNNFQMYGQWIATVPLTVFSIMAGALSDIYGRKPLILVPLIGYLLSGIDIMKLDFGRKVFVHDNLFMIILD